MNFYGNFKKLGEIDIEPIADLVEQLTDEDWTRENIRQKRFEVHQDTNFIGLVYDQDFRHMNASRCPALDLFEPVIHPVFKTIARYYESSPECWLPLTKLFKDILSVSVW